jgi:hypothetical protein
LLRHVTAGRSKAGKAALGKARQAWHDMASTGGAGLGRLGESEIGVAWQGLAGIFNFLKERLMAMNIERKLLTSIAKKNGGVLTIDSVLDEARDESSPLHKHFEWDDSVAADAHRRYQARVLIQRCRITLVEPEPVQIRAFVSLQNDRETGGGYRLTTDVMNDDLRKEELLHDIRLTIARWTKKLHLLDSVTAELLIQVEKQVNNRGDEDQQAAYG